jgi:putative RNA 2'-phosphotransferase
MPDSQKLSKFLSYVLRHRPDEIGLALDANGWALLSELIEQSRNASIDLTEETIREIVRSSDKQRFAISKDGTKIRASQGHSIDIDLALEAKEPPEILFHGTATRFLDSIRAEGLKPIGRQNVHLSFDEETAVKVGQRHGKPAVLRIRAGEMCRAGKIFYLSANGVWLTETVAADFIEFLKSRN